MHLSEAILKDLNLTYSLVSADFKAAPTILFSNLSIASQSLAGCPSSANSSSRSWKGVDDREESYCMVSKYRAQQGVGMSSDGDKGPLLQLGRASPEERACLCVMGIYTGGYSGTLILLSPKLSEIVHT